MDLNETVAFVAVGREKSFTKAGRRLGLPKATVSRRVTRLEARLAARLLQRSTRSVSLTEVGEAYFRRCLHAVEEIEDAERLASDLSASASGTLRVSAPIDVEWLGDCLIGFHREQPRVSLVVELTQRRVDLVAEGFDIALRGGKLAESGLIARRLFDSSLLLCASPTYLRKHGTPARIADLTRSGAQLLGHSSFQGRWRLVGPDGPVEIKAREWLSANGWGLLRAAALAGRGIAMMERSVVAADLRARRLRRVLPELGVSGGGLYAVYPSSHHLSPKVRVFIDYLNRRCAALRI